jgi:hypothetical protein
MELIQLVHTTTSYGLEVFYSCSSRSCHFLCFDAWKYKTYSHINYILLNSTGISISLLLKVPVDLTLKHPHYTFTIIQHRQVLFYARVTFLQNIAQIKLMKIQHKIPISTGYFREVKGLTTLSYLVHDSHNVSRSSFP